MTKTGGRIGPAIKHVRDTYLGPDPESPPPETADRPRPRRNREDIARWLWRKGRPLAGSIGPRYLAASLPPDYCASLDGLRFLDDAIHAETRERAPAILAHIVDPAGEGRGPSHFPRGGRTEQISQRVPRLGLGTLAGNAFAIGERSAAVAIAAESVEDGLAGGVPPCACTLRPRERVQFHVKAVTHDGNPHQKTTPPWRILRMEKYTPAARQAAAGRDRGLVSPFRPPPFPSTTAGGGISFPPLFPQENRTRSKRVKARISLNQALVDGLKPAAEEYILWDRSLQGYGVRVRPWNRDLRRSGAEGDRTRRRSLGRTGETTEAGPAPWRGGGSRPPGTGNAAGGRSVAFPAFAEEFLSRYRQLSGTCGTPWPSPAGEFCPFFAERTVGDIAQTDVARWFAGAVQPGFANRALPVLSVMMREAELYGYRAADDGNPCEGVRRYRRHRGERHLDARELAVLGRYLAGAPPTGRCRSRQSKRYSTRMSGRGGPGLEMGYVRDGKSTCRTSKTETENGPGVSASPRHPRPPIQQRPPLFPDRARLAAMTGEPSRLLAALARALRFPDVRLHDLRHTFASIAVQNGIPLATVGRLLGLPGETTLKYVHLSDDGYGRLAAIILGIAILRKGTGR